MHPGTLDTSAGLLRQFLAWVSARPRSYQETMDAWRTSCPRISVWEDALLDGLVVASDSTAGRQGQVRIVLTPAGVERLRQTER